MAGKGKRNFMYTERIARLQKPNNCSAEWLNIHRNGHQGNTRVGFEISCKILFGDKSTLAPV
jgi:hypothetical protein